MANTVTISRKLFTDMHVALTYANKLLNEDGTRLVALDQNPHGVRDMVYSAYRQAEKAAEEIRDDHLKIGRVE